MKDDYQTDPDDPQISHEADRLTRDFLEEGGAFRLGFLPTEGSHPSTVDFGETAREDAEEGIRMLLEVDGDLAPVARRVFLTQNYAQLVEELTETARRGNRICFSGCGSTGRLAIMLEEMWRQFWEDRKEATPEVEAVSGQAMADLACSIMTGGDRALVRAVEYFEDYAAFGARQVADLDLACGDLLVAISEGGETSSVLGTLSEAIRRNCRVFLVFNNPANLLRSRIERSREAIEDDRVTVLDLYSGSMALSGSTRMQATTLEMLILGTALEEASLRLVGKEDANPGRGNAEVFAALISGLRRSSTRRVLADLVRRESGVYQAGGLVTYLAPRFLLDIFSDTSERTPTFMLPPFRAVDDRQSLLSWAYALNPLLENNQEAWRAMLRRHPRGITWGAEDYCDMAAPQNFISQPPDLGLSEIHRYRIGGLPGKDRPNGEPHWWLYLYPGIASSPDSRQSSVEEFLREKGAAVLVWGDESEKDSYGPAGFKEVFRIPLSPKESPVQLWHHLLIKLIFNTVSTASMGVLERIRGNWMIQMDPTNFKLIDRGSRIIASLCGLSYEEACRELYLSILSRKKYLDSGGYTTTSPIVATLQRRGKIQ